ncbi:type II toxin-antitoxin system Phd/YefM family antitoxin [Candidatus Protofrankia californiensis]|uniref:type II toxin-antitoxin system Phd/YefM family antitoxin n=1 Tax=Candidatus Protofrankia californiensis TaxID=1839754 RepID=UPI001F49D51E|nr:type II toxin-antitoxin system prevent-host-death family antitoxin [Candidatus Protofrankia californiensis]
MNLMRVMTASEASRNFSALLDEAEHGETIVVTRSGRRIAVIMPAPHGNGEALREVLRRWGARAGVDDRFAADVVGAREAASAEWDTDPWRD